MPLARLNSIDKIAVDAGRTCCWRPVSRILDPCAHWIRDPGL